MLGCDGVRVGLRLSCCSRWLFVGTTPVVFEILRPMLSRRTQLFIELGCMRSLRQDLGCIARLCSILVGRASDLLPWAYDVTIATRSKVVTREVNHRERCQSCGVQARWMSLKTIGVVNDFALRQRRQSVAARFCSCSFSRFGCSRPLLSSGIFFGKPLLAGFRLPIVIPYATSVFDQPRPELPEHGSCGNNGDLTRPVRVWQDFLRNEIVFLRLVGDDLVQRPVLVKQQVRVPVA